MKYHVQDFVDCKLLILELLHLKELSIINNFSNSIKLALDSKVVNINKNKK